MWAFAKRLEFESNDWRSVNYESCRFRRRSNRFVKGVSQVLRLHKGSTLEEFRVSFNLTGKSKQEIDKWLEFASAKRVQRLELDFTFCNPVGRVDINDIYNLTNPTSLKTFESLKMLCLRRVNVSGEVLEGFLSCCPSLEKLTVNWSWALVHLKVQGPLLVLKHLEIRNCPQLSSVEICNVNLVSLVYAGTNISWVLHNAPALVNLTIGGSMCSPLNSLSLAQFSCCLSQLETLTIESSNYERIQLEVVDVPLNLSNLKKLVLNFSMFGDYSVIDCTPLIKASPKLQRFVLESMWAMPTIERREIRRVEKFQHQHIKEVEFRGYYGNKISASNDFALTLTDAVERSEEDLERVKAARRRAVWQLKGKMPKGVDIKILK